jgi:hypothetical protein
MTRKKIWEDIKRKLLEETNAAEELAILGPRSKIFPLIQQTVGDKNHYVIGWVIGGCSELIRRIVGNAMGNSVDLSRLLPLSLCQNIETRDITCSEEDAKLVYSLRQDIEDHKKWLEEYEKQVVQYRNAPIMSSAQYARVSQIMRKAEQGIPLNPEDQRILDSLNYAPIIFFNAAEKNKVLGEMEVNLQRARANYKELTAYRQKIINRITQKCPSLVLYSPNQLVSSATLSGTSTSSTQASTQSQSSGEITETAQARASGLVSSATLSGTSTSSTQASTQSQSSGEITETAQARASGAVPVFSSWAMCISRFPNDPEGQRQCMESMQRGPESDTEDVSTPAAVGAGAGIGTFLLVGALAFAAYWAYTNWFKKK